MFKLTVYNFFKSADQECTGSRLGMANGDIQDSQLSSSSTAGGGHTMAESRLDDTTRAWCAGANNANQWAQVDLGGPTRVTGVITQGRYESGQWVTYYKVLYSLDGSNFDYVEDSEGNEKVINTHQNSS